MDPRSTFGSYESAEHDTPRRHDATAPAARVQAWVRIAAVRSANLDLVPAQRDYTGEV